MIQFVCDTCGAIKQACEAWIVGHASETVGAVSARREVAIESIWNRTTTLHPLAVHFCSVQCKDEYMDRLFVAHSRAREVAIGGGGSYGGTSRSPEKKVDHEVTQTA